jgi:uncharacterized OB-fold protein
MNEAAYDKPLPKLDVFNRPFWELARKGKLAIQRCADCGDHHFPPGPVCPQCLGDRLEWEVVSGNGTLLSWITFHKPYWTGFAKEVPYDVCLVQLDEGPLLVSNLVGVESGQVAVGQRVRVVFERATEEFTLPKFTPAT